MAQPVMYVGFQLQKRKELRRSSWTEWMPEHRTFRTEREAWMFARSTHSQQADPGSVEYRVLRIDYTVVSQGRL